VPAALDSVLGVSTVATLHGAVALPVPAAALAVRASLWVPIFGSSPRS